MNPPSFGLPPSQRPPPRHYLSVVQQPERAKVVLRGKEKDRKPIDPPPIVQLFREGDSATSSLYFHNPYYVCVVTLWHPERDEPKMHEGSSTANSLTPLMGNCSASLNKLKDLHNQDGAYFVFSDISASVPGSARLKFTLQEMKPSEERTVCLCEVFSDVFDIMTAKDWDGPKESTPLSRSFADQGVRLRLRKESRSSANKRMFVPQPNTGPNTPIRPLPSAAASYGSHSSSAEDGEPSAKRPRSSTMSMTYSSVPGAHGHQGPQSAYGPVPGAPNYPPQSYGYTYAGQGQQYAQFPYRAQAPSEGTGFVSPFASPASQAPSQQYAGSTAPYAGYGGSYGSYSSVGSTPGYPAPYPSQSQQSGGSAYASSHDPYRSGIYGSNAASGQNVRPLGNPESTPRLPPIQSSQPGASVPGQAISGAESTSAGQQSREEANPYGASRN